jgi:hypothetical protein
MKTIKENTVNYFLLTVLSVGLCSAILGMEKRDKSIAVKLADDKTIHHIHSSIAGQSSIIYEKLQWKRHLQNHPEQPVSWEKPIVVYNVS